MTTLRLSIRHCYDDCDQAAISCLYLGDMCIVQHWHKPWHKFEVKSRVYRDLLYSWLRATDLCGRAALHDDYLCQALGEALTRQEWRYFKQAYYLAAKHVVMEVGPLPTLGSSVVANFSRVRKAYALKQILHKAPTEEDPQHYP